ncbi:MAG: hypothetical protein ABI613_10435, partial [Gemmatimonadota bacterium]
MTRTHTCRPAPLTRFAPVGRLAVLLALVFAASGSARPLLGQGELRIGHTGSGALSMMDPMMDDSSHYDMWTYRGKAGETIKVTLTSDAFDSYLSVGRMEGNDFHELDSDDDGAGGTNSKVVLQLPDDGEYAVRVNSLTAGETGAYTVAVEQGDPSEIETSDNTGSSASALPEPTAIHAGQTLNGDLADTDPTMDDTSHYDLYSFNAKRGQQATITMRSAAFDSYLTLGRLENGRFNYLQNDDDGAGGEDAKIVARISQDGQYAIRANSLFSNVSGAYTIRLEMGVAPPLEAMNPTSIHYGQTVSGELTISDYTIEDDTHADLYKFTGKMGDKLVITMKAGAF